MKLLILRLTERCNLACDYCYASSCYQGNDMSLDMAMQAIRQAYDGQSLKIQFTGGEPLLKLDLMQEIVAGCKQEHINITCSIQTNGTLLTPQTCTALKQMRCAIGVSLDGIGPANHLRHYADGKPAMDDIVAGLQNLAELGMGCNVNAVVSRANVLHLGELLQLCAYLGNIHGLGLDMFRPIGRGATDNFAPSGNAVAQGARLLLKTWHELKTLGKHIHIKEIDKVRFVLQHPVQEKFYCYAQTGLSAALDSKGDYYPCSSLVGEKAWQLGTVATGAQPPDSTINKLPEKCNICTCFQFCRGGCPAGRLVSDPSENDCLLHKTLIQTYLEQYNPSVTSKP